MALASPAGPQGKEQGMANGRIARYFVIMGVLVLAATSAPAESIDTLSNWSGESWTDAFGESADDYGAFTFGETFKILSGNARLQSITFKTLGKTPSPATQACTFEVSVMAWDGSKPTGPVLYMSAPLTTSSGFYPVDTFTLPLDNTPVRNGMEYVVFFTANNYLDGIRSDAMLATTVNDSYSDGMFVTHYGGSSFADLSAWGWYGSQGDVAMNLTYDIPEPMSLLLVGLGGLVLRRRTGC
jgi:hypothetical protein